MRWIVLVVVILLVACVAWIGIRAVLAERHLKTSVSLATTVEQQIASGDSSGAQTTAQQLASNADDARKLTSDPVWRGAEILPLVGGDLRAVRQVSAVLSNVSDNAIVPVTKVASTLKVSQFKPTGGAIDLEPLTAAQPAVGRAAADLRSQLAVARGIDTGDAVKQVDSAVDQLVSVLAKASGAADEADHALTLLPQMLGGDGPRTYLILFQNNAEVRSTGGIPGALAEIHAQGGRITLGQQASSADFPQAATPALKLPTETEGIYGSITGEYMQDVTLTPRFDLSAKIAQAMWKQKYGTTVDGVLSIDPVALGYLLEATGPITLPTGETLTSQNAVQTLLSDSYAKYPVPAEQDAFFAGAAASVFQKIASGSFDPSALLTGLTHATDEHRLLLWSDRPAEQATVDATALSGALPSSTPTKPAFGVYLDDSTGAKMDYYLKTQISAGQKACRTDGRPDQIVEVTLTNTAPQDAATTLPEYVTGGGAFGVSPGAIQTTVSVYAPKTGVFVGASQDGVPRSVHNAVDGTYPVAQFETKLSPGKTTTWRIEFLGGAARSAAPSVVQTPTINAIDPKKLSISCESPLS
ncbi:hypothetical protein AX769_10350 [Frondihabitans sp. PAMC 28766]|uniref:DUF4012 domain-containing protein n=1 Tax=Frondihabitans sp. PAMC 28766 TaxID=1795630 RepID=UPI00078E2C84|nr:DUF4012 domain-containing protein [Frondihabitans sp. PAMC 28766]AMM20474.1 hypothetical protein AX769_10350 [Frondihabitans sp. PAMC 28766]